MESSSYVLAALVTAVVALTEVIKAVLHRIAPPKLSPPDREARDTTRELVKASHELLIRLCEQHNRYDEDGVPVWYVPRSWTELNQKMLDQMGKIAELQRRNLELLERIERRIEREYSRRFPTHGGNDDDQ